MKKPNVFIRGIYATALTKIFLDAGYSIIYPSDEIKKRFDIPFRPGDSYSKDITIMDRLDKQGISIMFKKHIWEGLKENNFEDFPLSVRKYDEIIQYESRFHRNSIYRGIVVRSNKERGYSQIRLIPEEYEAQTGESKESPYQTTLGIFGSYLPEGKEGIFQVTHEDCGAIAARLGSYYTIPGDLIVINPYSTKILISKKIVDGKKKKELFDLGKELQQTKKYGFIFRTASSLASREEIIEEANRLEEKLIEVQNKVSAIQNQIGEISSEFRTINLLFPYSVKKSMDNIRREVSDTIDFHHTIKSIHPRILQHSESFNNKIALMDYTEGLMGELDKDNKKKANDYFIRTYLKDLKPRAHFYLAHMKLTGNMVLIGPGYIEEVDTSLEGPITVTVKRRFRGGGIYDGLGTPIEGGDYALTTYVENSWYYVHEYYSKDNELKGKYFNINTPLEITNKGVQYIDLEIDVVENIAGERKIIDKDLLDTAHEKGIIGDNLYETALKIAENIRDGKIN